MKLEYEVEKEFTVIFLLQAQTLSMQFISD